MNLKLTALVALSLVVAASPSRAQLLVAKDAPVAYGHHHLNVTSIPADVKFFETLGGTPITVAGRSIVKFPNVLIFFRQVQDAPGGTRGTTVNHIGFSVPNLRATIDKVKASGYQMITSTEATPDRQVKDDIAFAPVAGGASIAFVQAPDDIKVELVEVPNQATPIALHHVHFFHPANSEMQAWYVKTFGATSRLGGAFPAALLPGVALNFSSSPAPVVGTQGRAVDHIGFEVKNLAEFTKTLEANGIKLSVPYRTVPALGIAIAFFTDPWGTYIELTEGLDKVQ